MAKARGSHREELFPSKTRIEQEPRVAAEIQQALLPQSDGPVCRMSSRRRFEAVPIDWRRSSSTTPRPLSSAFGFTLGDVPARAPAALISAMMQGMFACRLDAAPSTDGPASIVATTINRGAAASARSRCGS